MSDRPDQPKYWACNVAFGVKVRVDDLPVSVFADINERTGTNWWNLMNAPLRSEKAGMELYKACCRHVGVEAKPDMPIREWTGLFELVDDDLPSMFTDGMPDDPKEPAMTS
jgi:hypothetical protein